MITFHTVETSPSRAHTPHTHKNMHTYTTQSNTDAGTYTGADKHTHTHTRTFADSQRPRSTCQPIRFAFLLSVTGLFLVKVLGIHCSCFFSSPYDVFPSTVVKVGRSRGGRNPPLHNPNSQGEPRSRDNQEEPETLPT